jgi:erythromycin esterase
MASMSTSAGRGSAWLSAALLLSACGGSVDTPRGQGAVGVAGAGGASGAAAVGAASAGSGAPELPAGIYAFDGPEQALPTADLAPFAAAIGDAPVVGLGESIHTSEGFLELRSRLIRYLVEARGFRAVTIESPHTAAEIVNSYVATCEGTPEAALQGVFAVWASASTRDLLSWLCQYNEAHPDDPVIFAGFDAQQPWDDIAALRAFLEGAAPADAPALLDGLSSCDGVSSATASEYYMTEWEEPYPEADLIACEDGIDDLDKYLTMNAAALEGKTSAEALEWARIAVIGLRSWQGEKYYYNSDIEKSYESRDVAMAEIFQRTRALLFPDTKTIVWAHNYHLTEQHDDVTGGGLDHAITMGTVLKDELGDTYQAVALLGYAVEINWPDIGTGPTKLPTSETSLELMLHGLGEPHLFVDLDKATAGGFIAADIKYQVGTPSPELMAPAAQFRAAFFLDHSPPMDAIFW